METMRMDFNGCKVAQDVHRVLCQAFGFSSAYAGNMLLLGQWIRGYEQRFTLEITGLKALPQSLKPQMDALFYVFSGTMEGAFNIDFSSDPQMRYYKVTLLRRVRDANGIERKTDTIWVDVTGAKDFKQVHQVLKDAFGFYNYYGMNFGALWDLLDLAWDIPLLVEVKGLDTFPKRYEDDVEILKEIFARVSQRLPNVEFVYVP